MFSSTLQTLWMWISFVLERSFEGPAWYSSFVSKHMVGIDQKGLVQQFLHIPICTTRTILMFFSMAGLETTTPSGDIQVPRK